MYDTKKYNSQFFYIGSWIYKTTLHKNLFTYNTCWQESEQLVLSQIEEGPTIVVQ